MAALNSRINITVPGEIAGILSKTAKQNKKSVSRVALELIEWAIEEREDLYFSRIADERMRHPKWVKDNENIWK
jgi:predicted DNA-binding protein